MLMKATVFCLFLGLGVCFYTPFDDLREVLLPMRAEVTEYHDTVDSISVPCLAASFADLSVPDSVVLTIAFYPVESEAAVMGIVMNLVLQAALYPRIEGLYRSDRYLAVTTFTHWYPHDPLGSEEGRPKSDHVLPPLLQERLDRVQEELGLVPVQWYGLKE